MEGIKRIIEAIDNCFPKEMQTDYMKGYFDGVKIVLNVLNEKSKQKGE